MPKIEVDEDEYQRLQRVQTTLRSIATNDKAKVLLQQAHKIVDPSAVTPDLDRQREINEPLEALKKEFEDYKTKAAEERAEREKKEKLDDLSRRYEAGKADLRRQNWTEEGIKKLEDFMNEKGIIDFDVAVPAFEKKFPPPPPATPSSGRWDFTDIPTDQADENIKKLLESRGANESLADKMAHDALREFRSDMGLQRR